MDTLTTQLNSMKKEIDGMMARLGIAEKAERAQALEAEAAAADFWSNPEAAQKTMQEIARLKGQVDHWRGVAQRINDALELSQLDDSTLQAELDAEAKELATIIEKMQIETLFSGPYDNEDAILAIHAGAGGVDSQDWAQMLERMYLRWAEENKYKIDVLERSEGEEAGLKSMMMSIRGPFAYGYLQSEQGVHRLVRLSPFDAAHRRHTSFAKVELWPDIQGEIDIEINMERDLRIDTYRSSGAGGQNVQKNETAVRIMHLPTGIVVTCQNERSQAQNRERALQILKARIFEMERKKQEAELAAMKGENVSAEWGNQIRSYVLHPYQMVKDHRTEYETGNTSAVLDGRLTEFMEAYLRRKITLTPA
ncbi:MAG: peptide chain release factor 2 [Chloroflexi bacterium]|nr:peptide chain release factor 2 [Chloroflexota bacterium]